MEMNDLKQIHNEVVALLKAFGYKPEIKKYQTESGKSVVDISFHVNNGYETMRTRYKDAIIMLTKGYLSEFYYGQDTQHVRLYGECNGLNPDDDRYSCLLHEIKQVDSNDPLPSKGTEIFVNMGDHFKRFLEWKYFTSKD